MKTKFACLLPILLALTLAPAGAAVRYVNLANSSPVPPYTTWATAAQVIQDAVDAAEYGDEVVVTNGVYSTGGRIDPSDNYGSCSRVLIEKPLDVRSVNGPEVTIIEGYRPKDDSDTNPPVRCVFFRIGENQTASLTGFTLTNGAAFGNGGGIGGSTNASASNCRIVGNLARSETFLGAGGGAFGVTLMNCTVTGNSANYGGGVAFCTAIGCAIMDNIARHFGGGVLSGMVQNCLVTGNSADFGGGACLDNREHEMVLIHCTITGNSARTRGGGVFWGRLADCIVYNNRLIVPSDGEEFSNWAGSAFSYSCTTPMPTQGRGNITVDPRFDDPIVGNFRLRSDSPCINSGSNKAASDDQDIEGNPRIAGGTMDMGAYEYQNPASKISYAWLQQFGLVTDGSADFADPDRDHFSNFQEWQAGTDPTNAMSLLRLLNPVHDGSTWVIRWQGVLDRSYTLERSTNLTLPVRFDPIATGIPGADGTMTWSYSDDEFGAADFSVYRIRVEN